MKQNRDPKINSCISGQLMIHKGACNMQQRKVSLFSKWCFKNWIFTYKEQNWILIIHHSQKFHFNCECLWIIISLNPHKTAYEMSEGCDLGGIIPSSVRWGNWEDDRINMPKFTQFVHVGAGIKTNSNARASIVNHYTLVYVLKSIRK